MTSLQYFVYEERGCSLPLRNHVNSFVQENVYHNFWLQYIKFWCLTTIFYIHFVFSPLSFRSYAGAGWLSTISVSWKVDRKISGLSSPRKHSLGIKMKRSVVCLVFFFSFLFWFLIFLPMTNKLIPYHFQLFLFLQYSNLYKIDIFQYLSLKKVFCC